MTHTNATDDALARGRAARLDQLNDAFKLANQKLYELNLGAGEIVMTDRHRLGWGVIEGHWGIYVVSTVAEMKPILECCVEDRLMAAQHLYELLATLATLATLNDERLKTIDDAIEAVMEFVTPSAVPRSLGVIR